MLLVGSQTFGSAPKAYGAPGATISGTVLDSVTHSPAIGVTVTTAGLPPVTATTNAAGAYTLNVPAGDIVLTASKTGYYVPRNSPLLTVANGDAVTGINFTLDQYASASGKIVQEGTTTGISNVHVKLFDTTSPSGNAAYIATTDAGGAWSQSDIVPGVYKVQFDASDTDFMTQWYEGKSTSDDATYVTIAPGAVIPLSATLVQGAKVSGTIRDGGGQPIANAYVLIELQSRNVAQTVTDSLGRYGFKGLGAGQYTVSAYKSGYVKAWYGDVEYSGGAQYFQVADSQYVTGKDITLKLGGTISGTITPAPASSVQAWVTLSSTAGTYAVSVATDGTYSISDLPPGDFTVEFVSSGYEVQFYDHVTSSGNATPVTVHRGQTNAGIDASLTKLTTTITTPVTITGKVLDLDGVPLSGVTVFANTGASVTGVDGTYSMVIDKVVGSMTRLSFTLAGYADDSLFIYPATDPYQVADMRLSRAVTLSGTVTAGSTNTPLSGATVYVVNVSGAYVASAKTAADGTYSAAGLREGFYTVQVNPLAVSTDYTVTFYGGAASLALATYVTAAGGSTVTGVNVHLPKTASISGTVLIPGGAPAAGATVTAISTGSTSTIKADAEGKFTFGYLLPGSYHLSAATNQWGVVWLGDVRNEAASTPIAVEAGNAVVGETLHLPSGFTVSGMVSDGSGARVGLTVLLRGAGDLPEQAVTDGSGTYSFRGIPSGSYTIAVVVGGQTIWLPGSADQATAATFPVTADLTKNITIPTEQAVTFTVTGSNSQVPPTGTVDVYDAGGYMTTGPLTDGSVTLMLFPNQTYHVHATAPGYGQSDVQVPVTVTTTSVPIVLPVGGTISGAISGDATYVSVVARNVTTGDVFTGDAVASSYTLDSLPAGDYAVAFVPGTQAGVCGAIVWYGGDGYLTATRVHVTAGGTATVNASASCSVAPVTHTVSGKVSVPSSVTLTDGNRTSVNVVLEDTLSGQTQSTSPAVDGTFSLSGVAAGTYLVTVNASSLGLSEASLTMVVSGADVSNVNLALLVAGSVTGRVVDAFGHIAATNVRLIDPHGTPNDEYASGGVFTFIGLSTGDYALVVAPDSANAMPYTSTTLSPVHVVAGHVTNVGTVALQAGGRISGLLPQDLFGSSSITIDAVDASGTVKATETVSGTGGGYVLWGVPVGQLYVRFSGPGVVTYWWRGAATQGNATPVTVVANQAVQDISPSLTPTSVTTQTVPVSGTITDRDGPVKDVVVSYVSAKANGSTTTAADGTYRLDVPAGDTYTISVSICFGSQSELECLGERYADSRQLTVGTTPVTGEDFFLGKPFIAAPTPTIAGLAAVGQTLAATVGTWQPTPDTLTLQWYAGGVPIGGAAGTTLTVAAGQIGQQITVAATGAKLGYVTKTLTSTPTVAVNDKPYVVAGTPTISGTPTLANVLTAVPGTWSPADVTYTYQWRRDGADIGGATSATYAPIQVDVGHTLTVVVTGSKGGYTSKGAESAPTGTIQSATSALAYEAFLKAAYQDFLGRQPTPAELSQTSVALSGGKVSTATVLSGLANSDEWLSAIVTKMYADTLGRSPDANGLATWVDWLRSGRFSVAQTAALFYSSPEYFQFHAGNTSQTWVAALYTKLLGRDGDAAGVTHWVTLTDSPTYGRDKVAYDFYQSTESRMHRVQNLYEVLLKREPDATGWPFWTQQVYTSGDIALAMTLANSQEYWLQAHQRY